VEQKETLGVTVGFALVGEANFFAGFNLLRNGDEFIARTCGNLYDRFHPWPITLPPQFSLMLAAFRS
jgi:hypothetical protein